MDMKVGNSQFNLFGGCGGNSFSSLSQLTYGDDNGSALNDPFGIDGIISSLPSSDKDKIKNSFFPLGMEDTNFIFGKNPGSALGMQDTNFIFGKNPGGAIGDGSGFSFGNAPGSCSGNGSDFGFGDVSQSSGTNESMLKKIIEVLSLLLAFFTSQTQKNKDSGQNAGGENSLNDRLCIQ